MKIVGSVFAFGGLASRAVLAESGLTGLVLEVGLLRLRELLEMIYFLFAFGLNALVFQILGSRRRCGLAGSAQHFLL